MAKYKVRVNKEKLKLLKEQLAPSKSWWALIGIFTFFFLPEIAAYYWGDKISAYFINLSNSANSFFFSYLYKELASLGENSYFNITLGAIFTIWFFKLKYKDKQK